MDARTDIGVDAGPDAPPTDAGDDAGPGPVCNPTSCATDMPCHEAVCMGTTCLVRSLCALGEECCAGTCAPIDCSDGIDCTVDSCGSMGCEHAADDAVCDAVAGGSCDPATGCQYPVCNSMTCVAGPCETAGCVGTSCERTPTCSPTQECCNGSCVPLGCDDGDLCTDDTCGATGCENANNTAPCDDGIACNGPDRCAGGSCSDHGPPTDDVQCGTQLERCCGGTCVDTSVDPNNCGFCGNVCPTGRCRERTQGSVTAGACNCGTATSGVCTGGYTCIAIGGPVAVCSCDGVGSCGAGQSCAPGTEYNLCNY